MKKTISFVLALAVTCAVFPAAFAEEASIAVEPIPIYMPVVASADNNEYKDKLAEAIMAVKLKLDIPSELSEFESSVNKTDDGTMFSMQWSSSDREQNIQVETDINGDIKSVYRYDNDWYDYNNDKQLSKYSREQALEVAKGYLEKINPDIMDKISYNNEDEYIGVLQDDFTFYFDRIENGIPVLGEGVTISMISAKDGNMYMSSYSKEWSDTEFPAFDNLIDESSAEKIYADNNYLELHYRKTYYPDNVLLEYGVSTPDNQYLDAETGKFIKRDDSDIIWYGKSRSMGMATGGAIEDGLTTEEQQEVDNLTDGISIDELASKAREIKNISLTDDQLLTQYRLYKQNDEYFVSMSFSTPEDSTDSKYTYITMNAKTFELVSVSASSNEPYSSDKEKTELTQSQISEAEKSIDAFLAEYAGTRYQSSKKDDTDNTDKYVSVTYTRQIDGIPFENDTIYVTWDTKTNMITNMYSVWSKAENLPDKTQAVSVGTAYDAFSTYIGLKKAYIISDEKARVVYTAKDNNVYINALTGRPTDYYGKEYSEATGKYTDISGHWAENIIKTLADNGIFTAGDTFRPDDAVTQKEYLTLLGITDYAFDRNYEVSDDELYEYMTTRGVISEGEKNPDSKITREDAVTYLLRVMGFKKAAEIKGIYVTDFDDSADISEDKIGYVAIAKGLGIINGSDGNVLPKKEMTRAEAAAVIYNYLAQK